MTTRHPLHDAGNCLRTAAPPLLTLSVLALAGTTRGVALTPTGVGEIILVAWRTTVLGTLLWFLVAVIWAATRPLRDRRAFQRLQHLREIATVPDRALVYVQTIVWSSAAGQQVVVVNVATGSSHRVWVPETTVPLGAFVVLERTHSGVRVVDWMNAHQVEAGHRHERRYAVGRVASGDHLEQVDREDALKLIQEAEQFLKEQECSR